MLEARCQALVKFAEYALGTVRVLGKGNTGGINAFDSAERSFRVVEVVMRKSLMPELKRLCLGITS